MIDTSTLSVRFLLTLCLLLPLGGCHVLYDSIGGDFAGPPDQMAENISSEAHAIIEKAFADIGEDDVLIDIHAHMISRNVNPDWHSPFWHPLKYGRTQVYLSGAGVSAHSETLEKDYVERMVAQLEQFPRKMRLYLYALDRSYYPDGSVDLRHTSIYVSNHDVYEISQQYPEHFRPVVSVHPFREDAIEELHYWADRGVRHVKWLPNAMGINPASPRLNDYYDTMIEHDMVLLTHTGDEMALEEIDAELGNPLLLRRPLDRGLKVVALHFASDGEFKDFENPRHHRRTPGHKLLLRMLDEPRYDGLLYIDTASMIFFNHLDEPLLAMLERPDLHGRFVNGSDYPLSALNITIWTRLLVTDGLLDEKYRRPLNEIYKYNPMLFEYVTKRLIRHPETGQRMRREVFLGDPAVW
ncbi:MAG: hypothetical protein WD294_04330 [Phycisphaeraceae bacterium]